MGTQPTAIETTDISSDKHEGGRPRVLDPEQLVRIEATHSGFLYQHLFAVGQLLVGGSEAASLLIETDEDVEIRNATEHIYVQVKNLTDVLQPSDVQPILTRFTLLRAEHQTGRRAGKGTFFIVSRSEPSQSLSSLIAASDWPSDVVIATPQNGRCVSGVPAWSSISAAIRWTVEAASGVPFSRLVPETLVWKLAAHVQVVATGKLYNGTHEIQFSELQKLREQLDLFADTLPPSPVKYRPQQDEPLIETGARIRVIVGVSGAGKTSWLSASAIHFAENIVFMRASTGIADVPGWIVRNISASMLGNSNEKLSAVFHPGAVSSESLLLLDRISEAMPIAVIVDNAHLINAADLAGCVRDSNHLRWVLLSQPGPQINSLIGRLGLSAEELGGWPPSTIASVLGDYSISCSPELAWRVRDVTAGLPLFVEGTARVAKEHYEGDINRLLNERFLGNHTAHLPQEKIIADDVISYLTKGAKTLGAILAHLRSDISVDLVRSIAADQLSLGLSATSTIRELTEWQILQPGPGKTLRVHDAFRPTLDSERIAMDSAVRNGCLRLLLTKIQELHGGNEWSLSLFLDTLRILTELGDGHSLVDAVYGGIEWLREYGAAGEVELLLIEALSKPDLSDEFQFLGANTLGYLAAQNSDVNKLAEQTKVCEKIANSQFIAIPDWYARIAVMRILHFGFTKDYENAKKAFAEYDRWADKGTEGYRVVRYDLAVAAHNAGKSDETHRLTTELIHEYFELLKLTPKSLFAKNIPDLLTEIDTKGFEDEFVHLAGCMYLRATAMLDNNELPDFDLPWSMKLYIIVNANSSALRAGLEWANSMIRCGAISEGLKVFEEQLVPLLEKKRFMNWLIPVYVDYAKALTAGGRFRDALARLKSVEVFTSSLSGEERQLYEHVALKVLAAEQHLGNSLISVPDGIQRIDRQRYDKYSPVRHPGASILYEEVAWFERNDRSAIGFISRDRTDDDFAWMVQRATEGQFSADDFNTSYESPEEAAIELMNAMLHPNDNGELSNKFAGRQRRCSQTSKAEQKKLKNKRKSQKAARKQSRKR